MSWQRLRSKFSDWAYWFGGEREPKAAAARRSAEPDGLSHYQATFRSLAEDEPGAKWGAQFKRYWPAYRDWYLCNGEAALPGFDACRQAMSLHMPEMVPLIDRLRDVAGGDDLTWRFLSLYNPPGYDFGCSQGVRTIGEPLLVRNYDYRQDAFDAIVLRSRWLGRRVIGSTDCLVGLLDGMNEDGLTVSLTFGGHSAKGDGFGIPIILRYVLETCTRADEAVAALTRIPSHRAYNVTVLDATGAWSTVSLSPGSAPIVSQQPAATNHQAGFADEGPHLIADTAVREAYILDKLIGAGVGPAAFTAAFLRPPLYSRAFDAGFGTLYTAAYSPATRTLQLRWPELSWDLSIDEFEDTSRLVRYGIRTENSSPTDTASAAATTDS